MTKNLDEWFRSLVLRLREQGSPVEITSGMACVHYRVSEVTKDCDLWVPYESLEGFLGVVSTTTWQHCAAQFRSPFSAPLHNDWLSGGWSAHISWTGKPEANLDIFGILPRTLDPNKLPDFFSSESKLAQVKMTDRDRDWPYVHVLGQRLIDQGNSKGMLYLQRADSLLAARASISDEQWRVLVGDRPLLKTIESGAAPVLIDAFIRTERQFWMEINRLRLKCYREASREYAVQARRGLLNLVSLRSQNEYLISLANEFLPTHPLLNQAQEFIDKAEQVALINTDRELFDSSWLPREWAARTIEACCPKKDDFGNRGSGSYI